MVYNRQESRLLEFACLSVFVAININAYTCNIMEIVTYFTAVIAFTVFNIFRVGERVKYLRLLFFLPLIAAYLPFLIFKKELKTYWQKMFSRFFPERFMIFHTVIFQK